MPKGNIGNRAHHSIGDFYNIANSKRLKGNDKNPAHKICQGFL